MSRVHATSGGTGYSPMPKTFSKRLWQQEGGFSLFEVVIALAIVGTAVIATGIAMANTARVSVRSEESVTLTQLLRAQIETIQQSPFLADPTQYPKISGIPDGFSVTFSSSDPGTAYAYPTVPNPPLNATITNVIQKIVVTATGDFSTMSMTFYKIKSP